MEAWHMKAGWKVWEEVICGFWVRAATCVTGSHSFKISPECKRAFIWFLKLSFNCWGCFEARLAYVGLLTRLCRCSCAKYNQCSRLLRLFSTCGSETFKGFPIHAVKEDTLTLTCAHWSSCCAAVPPAHAQVQHIFGRNYQLSPHARRHTCTHKLDGLQIAICWHIS